MHFGWTKLTRPLSMDLYSKWIEDDLYLDMTYLKNHQYKKEHPRELTKAQSAIVFVIPYLPHPWPEKSKISSLPIALYAQGKDYHTEVPKVITPLLDQLKLNFPEEFFEFYTDSAPVMERDLAYKAGLGWIGKNTCLIHPKFGSLFFIAEIYTSLSLQNDNPWSSDFCGTCNKCIEACPTNAISPERKLEPSKCISYWNIESKNTPPVKLRSSIGSWLFGCDICQTVCPWNQKHLKQKIESEKHIDRNAQLEELHWILTSSRKTLARYFSTTPLARVAGWKLQRNAIIVITNNRYVELATHIQPFMNDSKLSEIATWSLGIIKQIDMEKPAIL